MTLKNPSFGFWDKDDFVTYKKHRPRPCLDAEKEAEAMREHDYPCITYFVDPETLKEEKE